MTSQARALDAELQKHTRMIALSHDAIIMTDAERRITDWNRGACELYGWTEEEALGNLIHLLLKMEDSEAVEKIDAALRREDRWDGELVHTCKDGKRIITESRQILLRNEQGHIEGRLEIDRDITDRKRLEQELHATAAAAEQARRTLETVMDHLPEGLTIADAPDVTIRMVSRWGAELAGRPREALVNTPASEHPSAWGIYHPDAKTPARPEELPLTRPVLSGEISTDEEWAIQRPDGRAVPVLCNAAPIRDADGRITGGLIAWRDISERQRLEHRLRESAKLESLDTLAGGIAHDFNNLLTGVVGNASLLLDELREGSAAWSYAQGILDAGERAASLSLQMLAYSGRGQFLVRCLDLSAHIREAAPLLASSIPGNVELHLDLADRLPLIKADPGQLHQVLMNLVINGAEAIDTSPGCVTVATRPEVVNDAHTRIFVMQEKINPGEYVVLEVSDNGCGMDGNTVARIFDPFFTTKFLGRGLGLAAVQGIVRGHKGAMRVYSTPGHGTTLQILFPAVTPERTSEPEQDSVRPAVSEHAP